MTVAFQLFSFWMFVFLVILAFDISEIQHDPSELPGGGWLAVVARAALIATLWPLGFLVMVFTSPPGRS